MPTTRQAIDRWTAPVEHVAPGKPSEVDKQAYQRTGSDRIKMPIRGMYTEERHDKVVEAIRNGNSIQNASALAGMGYDTLWSWLEKGKYAPDKYPHYAQLVLDIDQARAEMEGEMVGRVVETARSGNSNSLTAATWWLQKRSAEWAQTQTINVHRDTPDTVNLNQVVLVDSDARTEARDLLRGIDRNGSHQPVGPSVGRELEEGTIEGSARPSS